MNNQTVSFDDELLIVVDKDDNIIDYKPKDECHAGDAILHRAFSIFIFNEANELLLQKRSKEKPLWPKFWSNSCCSHPRKGESRDEAAVRRLKEELGFTTDLKHLYTFDYFAPYSGNGSEREVCAVYLGFYDGKLNSNPTEVADTRWVHMDELTESMETYPERYTPWFKMEWERLLSDFSNEISGNISQSQS